LRGGEEFTTTTYELTKKEIQGSFCIKMREELAPIVFGRTSLRYDDVCKSFALNAQTGLRCYVYTTHQYIVHKVSVIHTHSRPTTMNTDTVLSAEESYRMPSCKLSEAVCCNTVDTTSRLNICSIRYMRLKNWRIGNLVYDTKSNNDERKLEHQRRQIITRVLHCIGMQPFLANRLSI